MQQHLFRNAGLDEVAMDVLREFEPQDQPYDLAYSGGKDSGVILDLAKRSGVRFRARYAYTWFDPPELRAFIREQAADPANRLRIEKPARSLLAMVRERQFMPRRGARWCCEEFKERMAAPGCTTILGLRRDEGRSRRERALYERRGRTTGFIVNPIIGWTASDVWTYIRERGLAYCGLYDEGETRLGCVLCPLARNERPHYQAEARRQIKRWPGIARLWTWMAGVVWAYHQADFETSEALWEWWLRSEARDPRVDDGECDLFGPPVDIAENEKENP